MATLLHSRYLLLGIVTLLFGIAILTFNFGNEYLALDRDVPLRELPSVRSALKRTGSNEKLNARIADLLQSGEFSLEQFYRIGNMMLPYAANLYQVKERFRDLALTDYPVIALGILALGVCLAGLVCIRYRRSEITLLLATLTFSGFCWALPLSYNVTYHDFESVFYIGIPLVACILALRFLRRWHRGRLAPYFAVAALAVFIFSVSAMAGVGQSRTQLAVEAEQMADYAAIRKLADDNADIHIPWGTHLIRFGGATWASLYFMAGKTLNYQYPAADARLDGRQGWEDYLLLPTREDNKALLTPENRHIFLYDYALYEDLYDEADLGRRIITADWNVYLRDGRLVYASVECANWDAVFLLHFVPADAAVLPAVQREFGYGNHDFVFQRNRSYSLNGRCVVERPLPEYDIIAIRTGQYNAAGQIWEGEYLMPASDPNPVAPGR